MAYVDKDRQREYQREWARKKGSSLGGKTHIARGIIYWKDLVELKEIPKIKDFDGCVKEARKFIVGRRINRIAIAELAAHACVLRWGGDRRTRNYADNGSQLTLVKFAESVGVSKKTLFTWIDIKRKIIDKLSVSDGVIDWTAAQFSHKTASQTKEDPLELYKKYYGSTKKRSTQAITKYILYCANFIDSKGKGAFSKPQWADIQESLKRLMNHREP